MSNFKQRLEKMDKCRKVEFAAKDKHGDSIYVNFEGEEADAILQFLKNSLSESHIRNNNYLKWMKL